MAKETIGYFQIGMIDVNKNKTHEYNIYYNRGYKKQRDRIYIGNSSQGWFFYFKLNKPEEIILKTGDYTSMKLHKPLNEIDIAEILNMIFRPKGIKLLSLSVLSRDELCKRVFVDGI